MRNIVSLNLLLALVLTLGCARAIETNDTDPFLAPKGQVKGKKKVYAVAPVRIPDGLPDPEIIIENFDGMIQQKLSRGGISVVYPHQYIKIWDRLRDEAGGFMDWERGRRDPDKMVEAMVQTIAELGADFSIDAVLIPSVVVVEAQFASGRAIWDGAAQSIKIGGPLKDFIAGSPDGVLGALSLKIDIYSPAGIDLYSNAGGIEVLSKLSGNEFVLVPRQELFKDEKRNQKAVDLALGPLLK